MKLKKVKSFTLVEMLIVLFLTALLSVLIVKTVSVISITLEKSEKALKYRNTANLVFEYYRAIPFKNLFYVENRDVSYIFVDPTEESDLRLFLTVIPFKGGDIKKIELDAVWGDEEDPFIIHLETLRYKYGL